VFKTIKIPINLSEEDSLIIKDLQCQYSDVVRYSYNRYLEGLEQKEIRLKIKDLRNIELLNSWIIQCAILDAKSLYTKHNKNQKNSKPITFGGKFSFRQYNKKLITKEELKDKRLRPIDIQGEQVVSGNRMFDLNIQDDNSITFKLNRYKHIKISLCNLKNNWLNDLWKLEYLTTQKEVTYSIKLTTKFIYISFDDKFVQSFETKVNRCIGIDMNPDYIGLSVLEFDKENNFKVLNKQVFEIKELTIKSKRSSKDPKSIYLHNKLQHETIEITSKILKIAKAWNCRFVFIEDLNFKQKIDNKNKEFNRKTKNKWLRCLFIEQLNKRLSLYKIKLFEVNPTYSSIIGNLMYNNFDPINASIEIARRGMNVIILKTKKFYPNIKIKDCLSPLWKQELRNLSTDWNGVFKWLKKNPKVRYRVSLNEVTQNLNSFSVFSLNSIKSKVKLYNFI
jgi:IS605 OrfB family transposase